MITTCPKCGKLYDERSSDEASAPDRVCSECYKNQPKAIKTDRGYLSWQGNEHWFESEPIGWTVVHSDAEYLGRVAEMFGVKLYEIVEL